MTAWGAWSYAGGNGVRLGADWNYSGSTLNVWISTQTQYNYSGDVWTLTWGGSYGGSAGLTMNSTTGAVQTPWSGSFTQAYNSTVSLTFSGSAFYNGSAPSVSFSSTLGPLPPAAPTSPAAAYVSDAQVNTSWVDNPTGTAPYDNVVVYRRSNTDPDTAVAVLGGTAASYADTGVVADRKLSYIFTSSNSGGATNSALSNVIYTTPAAPTGCTATKSGAGDITVTWTNASTYAAETPVEVWHAANGTWDGAALTTISAGAAATYTHSAPNPSQTHQYRVRAKTPSGTTLYSGYSTSGVVQLLARPNAPTSEIITSTQQSGAYVEATFASTLSWTHNPVDSSAQTAYEVQYQISTDGGATFGSMVSTGKITSGVSSRTITASTWANNRVIKWQARTWGAYAGTAPTYSDWGTLVTFYTSARPVGTITSGTTATTSHLTATATYADAESSAQSGARWSLRTTLGVTLETATLGPADSASFLSYTFTTVVQDATSYVVAYQAQDGPGLWSAEVTRTVAVAYTKPATPTLVVTYSDLTGAVSGTVTNPPPTTEPAAVYNIVYRDGVPLLALSNIPPSGSFQDPIPPLKADVVYTVVAVSATPSSSLTSTAQHVNTTSAKVFLNGGPGMGTAIPLPYGPRAQGSPGRDRVWRAYQGRAEEQLYVGVNRTWQLKVTALVDPATLAALEALEDRAEPSCYRDPRGRKRFVGISDLTFNDGAGDAVLQRVSLTVRACGYSE
ncbi:hypothetical protein [Tessaracoccus sp.]